MKAIILLITFLVISLIGAYYTGNGIVHLMRESKTVILWRDYLCAYVTTGIFLFYISFLAWDYVCEKFKLY